jgi:hypothetical protein
MHRELLAQSHLLILPIVALFLFIAVFVAVVIRAMARSRADIDAHAALPFADEDRHEQ